MVPNVPSKKVLLNRYARYKSGGKPSEYCHQLVPSKKLKDYTAFKKPNLKTIFKKLARKGLVGDNLQFCLKDV